MKFMVVARDQSDALDRRMAVRETHLAGVRDMIADGRLISGGAFLNDDGQIIGSICIVDMPSRADVEAWIAADPYTANNVWGDIEIREVRLAHPA